MHFAPGFSTRYNSLKKWTAQKWKWSGGDKPGQGGRGVYLPEKKVERLKSTEEGRKKLTAAARKKSAATRAGEQYSSHGLAAGTSLQKRAQVDDSRKKTQIAIKRALNRFAKTQGVDPKKAMLVAGGAAYMHGMRHEINDIDFFHEDLKDFVKKKQGRFEMDGGPAKNLSPAAKDWEMIGGMRVQTPAGMLAFYEHLNRPKDQEKIKTLRLMLSAPSGERPKAIGLASSTPLQKKAFALAFQDELTKIAAADPDEIFYGNSSSEHMEEVAKKTDRIRAWFSKSGIFDEIVKGAPQNSSETTRRDLETLVKKMRAATAEDLAFARYADSPDHCAQMFIDLLQTHGYKSTMGEYFGIDSQVEPLLFSLKDKINRPRPYQLARYFGYPIFPLMRTDAMTASYPSGHALMGFVMGEYYARKFPKIAGKLRALGERIADSREVTGIHYPSDTAISRQICKLIFENNLLKEYR